MELTGVMLFCKDMKTMGAFYRDVVGILPDEHQPFPSDSFFRFHSLEGATLCLHKGTKPNGGRQKLMFQAPNLAALFERLKTVKPHFRQPEPDKDGNVVFDFYDPEKNRIQVYGKLPGASEEDSSEIK